MSTRPPRVEEVLSRMREDSPIRRQSRLMKHEGISLRLTLMKRAWEQSDGIEFDEPGEVVQWYFEDEDLVVIDLDPGE